MSDHPLLGRPQRGDSPHPLTAVPEATKLGQALTNDLSDSPSSAGTASGNTITAFETPHGTTNYPTHFGAPTPRQMPPIYPGELTPLEDLIDPHVLALLREANRFQVRKPPGTEPRYGVLYDSLRSRDAFDRMIDLAASGTFTPAAANAAVSVAITLAQAPNYRLAQYPGGINLYLMLRYFAYAVVPGAATGLFSITYTDPSGALAVPLGVYNAAGTGAQADHAFLIPSPLTDPTTTVAGTLIIQSVSIASPQVCSYQIGFSEVFLSAADTVGYQPIEGETLSQRLNRQDAS